MDPVNLVCLNFMRFVVLTFRAVTFLLEFLSACRGRRRKLRGWKHNEVPLKRKPTVGQRTHNAGQEN